jgi:hypothetical protein
VCPVHGTSNSSDASFSWERPYLPHSVLHVSRIGSAENAAHLPTEVSAGLPHLQKLQLGRPADAPAGPDPVEDHAVEVKKFWYIRM